MKSLEMFFYLLLLFVIGCTPARYHDRSFFSEAFQTDRSYRIYLPADYQTNNNKRYPVIYYFHGWGGRYKWDSYDLETDVNYPANGRREPPYVMEWSNYAASHDVIIVTWDGYEPNNHPGKKKREGLAYGTSRPYDCNMAHEIVDNHWGWDYRRYFQDLVTHIDHTYRTIANRSQRGVTGLSMGGQAALYITGQN